MAKLHVLQVDVERFSILSSRPFAQVIAAIDAAVGHPDMRHFAQSVGAAKNNEELEAAITPLLGPSGFMEFVRFNLGQILEKSNGPSAPKIVRIVIGNPLVMRKMAEQVPDTASYAPVSVLIDERADGVHLSYDSMVSCLAPYGNEAALEVAHTLDGKVEELLSAAAG